MVDETIYASLGKLTEEMYLSLAKTQSSQMQDQLVAYHSFAEKKIAEIIKEMGECCAGEMMNEYKKKLQILHDDFCYMKNDINNKYKIYLRGCGKAGKSTLLNALLSLDESIGSRMGRLPMTFIVDMYTEELSTQEAEVRTIEADGNGKYTKMDRAKAIQMEDEEERLFSLSKEKCRVEIEKKCKKVFLQQEREDIERDIYQKGLLKTSIREIKWGIGKNNFFRNCVLIDTPGLSQELRFTNVIEDVKNYEVDGIIWVISSESLAKQEVIDAYKEEMKEMQAIYEGRKIIAVINMYGSGEDYTYGSRMWNRIEKRAKKIYCDTYGFDKLICVNAKLAYDGNIKGNEEDIQKSNISELRKIINEMFVERSTETYHYDKLNKIDSFLTNLYKETKQMEIELRKKQKDYEDKENKIKNQEIACENLVKEDREKILRKHFIEIRGKINRDSEIVQNLGQWSEAAVNTYLANEIVNTEELRKNLNEMLQNSSSKVYSRFQEQQIHSIISGFKTEQYALQYFEKSNTSLVLNTEEEKKPEPMYKINGWDITRNIITNIFGKNIATRFISGILEGFRNAIKSPQDRLYESIKESLEKWAQQWNLSETITNYAKLCRKTLDKSMEQTCCCYDDIELLLLQLSKFNSEKPQMEWEKVGLEELLGGCLE